MGDLGISHTLAEIEFNRNLSGPRQEGLMRIWTGFVTDHASEEVIKIEVTVKRALPGVWVPGDSKLYACGRMEESRGPHENRRKIRTWRTPVPEDFEEDGKHASALALAMRAFEKYHPDSTWAEVLQVLAFQWEGPKLPATEDAQVTSPHPYFVWVNETQHHTVREWLYEEIRTALDEETGESVTLFQVRIMDSRGLVVPTDRFLVASRIGSLSRVKVLAGGEEADKYYESRLKLLGDIKEIRADAQAFGGKLRVAWDKDKSED